MTIVTAPPYARHLVPDAELLEHLSGLLADSPRSMKEMETLTGYTHRALKSRLDQLITGGRAHRQRINVALSFKYIYHYGPGDGRASQGSAAEVPRQVTARQYPPINRRDPLVAALFGAPGVKP